MHCRSIRLDIGEPYKMTRKQQVKSGADPTSFETREGRENRLSEMERFERLGDRLFKGNGNWRFLDEMNGFTRNGSGDWRGCWKVIGVWGLGGYRN